MTLEAALDAMTTDSQSWTKVSETLTTASTNASGLGIAYLSWPQVISDIPLSSTYDQLQSKVVALLAGGAAETDAISNTLVEVRNAYQDTDERARQEFDGVWDPIL